MPYSEYMGHVIDHLIQIQDTIPQRAELAPKDRDLLCKQHPSVRSGQSSVVSHVIPPTSPISWHIQGIGDTSSNRVHDVNFPDKEWGYLALDPTGFQFIGPDRDPIDMSNTSQYLRAAEVIRESGLPNYRDPVSP